MRPSFVRDVLDAVADGDDETARSLVADLHPADIADLIELAPGDERGDLIEASMPTSMPSSTIGSART